MVTKKINITHQQGRLLYTNLGDGVLCTLLPNHNIHGCLSAMDNIGFKTKMHFRANSRKTRSLGGKPL